MTTNLKKKLDAQRAKAVEAKNGAAEGSPERTYWESVEKNLVYAIENLKDDPSGASTVDGG